MPIRPPWGRHRVPRRQAVWLAAVLLLGGAGCQSTEILPPPAGQAPLVVHAVLEPAVFEQTILLERAFPGQETTDSTRAFDPDDPIVSSGGTPVSGAMVIVRNPNFPNGNCQICDTAFAFEVSTTRSDGKGRGVYRFRNTPYMGCLFCSPAQQPPRTDIPIIRGGDYELDILVDGQTLVARTTVPNAVISGRPTDVDTLDRARDSLALSWPASEDASRFVIGVAGPAGSYFLFTGGDHAALPGTLQNPLSATAAPVFVPGFQQTVTLGAVDRNYFDYYRGRYEPVGGLAPVTHVTGGFGLFGSEVPVQRQVVEIVADSQVAPGGVYRPSPAIPIDESNPDAEALLTLYRYQLSDGTTHLSGKLVADSVRSGVLGTLAGDSVTLAILRGQTVSDTLFLFSGRFAGDSLAGSLRGRGPQIFRRQRPP